MQFIVGGIDLSASHKRKSGICIIVDGILMTCEEKLDDSEIIDFLYSAGKPRIIAIDAPLSIVNKGFRDVERLLIKEGYKLLPLGLESMKKLAKRAIKLRKILESDGVSVIETHPRSALISAGCNEGSTSLLNCLSKYVKLESNLKLESKDARDAAVAACIAWMYANNNTLVYQAAGDSIHLLPRLDLDAKT
ncbi:MAG: DUF429 domain-containing protein [Desulfurococcales archaeon]|nr:DUF429 domain-containing protein [Desulfurococcales archaeon]